MIKFVSVILMIFNAKKIIVGYQLSQGINTNKPKNIPRID